MRRSLILLAVLALCACATTTSPRPLVDSEHSQLIDLSWSFDEQTLYWPNSPSTFELKQLSYGPAPAGFFYASNSFCAPEHGGTHLDAPIHFAEGKHTADQIPLEQ